MRVRSCDFSPPDARPCPTGRAGGIGPSGPVRIDGAGLWMLATALAEEHEDAARSASVTCVAGHPPTAGAPGDRDGAAGSPADGSYEAYIRSDAWRRSPARLAELRASGRRCRLCDRGPPDVALEVHHRTYARFGRELVGDLTTVCHECRPAVTDVLRARRHARRDPPAPRDVDARQHPVLAVSEWLDGRP